MAADLDVMLERADAAIVIGDPALMALEERANRFERTGEELVYHDLAEEWRALHRIALCLRGLGHCLQQLLWTRVCTRTSSTPATTASQNIDALVAEWSRRIAALRSRPSARYLTANIHYVLDEECIEGMRGFFRMAAQTCGELDREYETA